MKLKRFFQVKSIPKLPAQKNAHSKVIKECQESTEVSALFHEELKLRSQLQEKQSEISERKHILDEYNDDSGEDLAAMVKTIEDLNKQCAGASRRIEEAKLRLRQKEEHNNLVHRLELPRMGATLLKAMTKTKQISVLSTDHFGLRSNERGDRRQA